MERTHPDPTSAQRIWLLGGLRAAGPTGAMIPLPGGRARALLAYLVLNPRAPHSREILMDLLWPESLPDVARRNLTSLLYVLRRAVGPQMITATSEAISLCANIDLWVDVWEFERLVAQADLSALVAAVDLYTGDLLPELYDDWLSAPRAALHDRYLATLLRLAEAAADLRPAEATDRYRRLLARDPLHEEARRGLMRCLARLGRRREALAAYADLVATLESELGTTPESATRLLADEIGRESAPPPEVRPAEPTFVGRTAERAALLARLEQARSGRGGLAAILGEAGVGKTRLLAELARAAGWRGWQVIWASAPQVGDPAPYAPLAAALATALAGPRLAQIASVVQPLWLSMLAGIIPGLRLPSPYEGEGPGVRAEGPGVRAEISHDPRWLPVAVGHVLAALAAIAPHLLILDDVQWADPALWPLLDELRPRLGAAPLLLFVCGRSEDLPEAAWDAVARWDAAGAPCLRLGGMAEAEIADLAAAVGVVAPPPDQLAHIARASGGSPLLALALLRDGGDGALRHPSLATFFQRRLARISAPAAAALVAASALGAHFAYELWEGVVGRPRTTLTPALSQGEREFERPPGRVGESLLALALELEQAGLLLPEPGGYRFAHDTLRAHLYASLSTDQRRDLHRRAMVACAPDDALARLYHASEAGDAPTAALAALAAAERELVAQALPAARRHFAQALALLPAHDLPRRYRAARGHLAALAVSDNHVAALESLDSLDALALQIGDPRCAAEAATLRADRCIRSGHVADAEVAAARARDLAVAAGDAGQEARALELIAQLAQQRGDYRTAQTHLLAARARYQAAADPRGEATTAHNLALVAWAVGDHQGAIAGYARAADLFQHTGDLLNQARALNGLGCARWGLGNYQSARNHHQQALDLSRELSDRWGEATTILNLGQVALAIGDYVAAIDSFAAALTDFRALGQQAGVAAALSNLAQAYALLGDRAAALSYAAEALRASQAAGLARIEGYAHHNRGLALLNWHNPTPPLRHAERGLGGEVNPDAAESLRAACAIRERLGERENLAESRACLALTLAAGHPMEAVQAAAAARADLADSADRAVLHQLVAYASHVAARAAGDAAAASAHIQAAARAMDTAAAALPPAERARFLQQVPLNRATQSALDALSQIVTARLVRADVPLGRSLTPADYLSVRWTLVSPADTAIPRADERRRHVLLRLLAEAAAQGAAPTDANLAAALRVSRRTIIRDIEHLAASGIAIPTRHRR